MLWRHPERLWSATFQCKSDNPNTQKRSTFDVHVNVHGRPNTDLSTSKLNLLLLIYNEINFFNVNDRRCWLSIFHALSHEVSIQEENLVSLGPTLFGLPRFHWTSVNDHTKQTYCHSHCCINIRSWIFYLRRHAAGSTLSDRVSAVVDETNHVRPHEAYSCC